MHPALRPGSQQPTGRLVPAQGWAVISHADPSRQNLLARLVTAEREQGRLEQLLAEQRVAQLAAENAHLEEAQRRLHQGLVDLHAQKAELERVAAQRSLRPLPLPYVP